MLAVAMMVGTRFFTRDVLERLFHRETEMFKQVPFIEEWMEESEAQGETREARRFLLRQLQEKFGDLPPSVVEEIERADRAACEDLGLRLLRADSLETLGIGTATNGGTSAEP